MENYSNISFIEPKYKDLIVIVPAFNEEAYIASFILKVRNYAETIILVDDNSSDETVKIARYVNPSYILKNSKNVGHYKSVQLGLKKAMEFPGKYILILDVFPFGKIDLIDDTIKPLTENNEIDVSFGIYENIFNHYQNKFKSDIHFNKEIISDRGNIALFVFRKDIINRSIFSFPESYDNFIDSLSSNNKFILQKLNVKKQIRKSPTIIKIIQYFVLSYLAILIFIIILGSTFPEFSLYISIFSIIVFAFGGFTAYKLYRRDLIE